MPGKRYSAGAIFLQVVPVFANVQKAIEDEVKDVDRALGDRMEKAGEKAGDRAGKAMGKKLDEHAKASGSAFQREFEKNVGDINKALDGIDTQRLGNKLRSEVAGIKREMRDLGKTKITGEADFRRVYAELEVLKGRMMGVRDDIHIAAKMDIDQAMKSAAKLEAVKESLEDDVEIEVRVDTKGAERQMSAFEKKFKQSAEKAASHLSGSMNKEVKRVRDDLVALQNLRIGVDISAGRAKTELAELMADLKAVSSDDVDVDVKLETHAAFIELAAFDAAINKLDGKDVEVDVKVNDKGAHSRLRELVAGGDDAANTFRSFNGVLFAATALGPGLVPVLAAIAAGLLAIGPAAAVGAAGLASVLIGFSGIGAAYTALSNQQSQAAKSTEQASDRMRSAMRAVRDARQSLADAERTADRAAEDSARRVAQARRQAAEQIESALKRQREAQQSYADSVKSVRDAENDLRQAREDAAKSKQDLGFSIRENQLAIDQGLVDEFNAQVNFNAVMADGSSTNLDKEQARIALEQARLRMEELRAEQKRLAEEKIKQDKGISESQQKVNDAQDRYTKALRDQKDALNDLKEAEQDVRDARAEGARAINDALREQRRSAEDNARAVARAQQGVNDALADQADALSNVSTQQEAVNEAMAGLGPAGQHFARFLFGLQSGFQKFRNQIQAAMLPSIEDAITGFLGSKNGGTVGKLLVSLAGSFGRFVKALSTSFQGPVWGEFFSTLAAAGPQISKAYGTAFIKFAEAIASMLTTAAPYAVQFANGLAKMMTAFADWAKSKEGQEGLQRFFDYAATQGPKVLDFLGHLALAAVAIAKALAPWGDVVLATIDGFLRLADQMDPKVLGAIVLGLIMIVNASQTAYAVMQILLAAGALFASTVGVWVVAIVAIVSGLAILFKTNKGFHDWVVEAWPKIAAAFKEAWEESIKPALSGLWDAVVDLWKGVLQPFLSWFGPIFIWLIQELIPLLGWVFTLQVRAITGGVRVMTSVFRALGAVFTWVWRYVAKPIWSAMGAAFKILKVSFLAGSKAMGINWTQVGRDIKWAWENLIRPTFNWIKDHALPALSGAFGVAVEAIKTIWESLKAVVGAPIKFVIDTIINKGLIAGFNQVAKWVGQDGFDPIPIPKWMQAYRTGGIFQDPRSAYATGGVLPGYTPGRDPHKFVSPTGGRLELSGGEAIMRPEFTAAVGSGFVDTMNAIARTQGIGGVRKALGSQAYAKGGVFWPLPHSSWSTYPGHDGIDLNAPNDMGKPFFAAVPGTISYVGWGKGYGDAIFESTKWGTLVYGHGSKTAVHAGQKVGAGQYIGNVGSTGHSTGPHLHFGFPGGTPEAALGLLRGSLHEGYGKVDGGAKHRRIPGWLMDMVKNPLGAVKGWVTDTWSKASTAVRESPAFDIVKKVPLALAKKVTDKAWGLVPGWVKTAAGWAGEGADWVVGGVKHAGEAIGDAASGAGHAIADGAGSVLGALGIGGYADGGILPYNGTMMYDNGGYLPPGLTTVMNLTGKPEPVFTADQFAGMGTDGSGGNLHYEPHFYDSDLTAEDVAGDMNFAFRKMKRGGKYEGVGAP